MGANKNVPPLHNTLLIAEDPYLTASVCSVLSIRKKYLPVIDFPRLQRNDYEAEITRRNNSAARLQPKIIIMVSPTEDIRKSFQKYFSPEVVEYIYSLDDLKNTKAAPQTWHKDILHWERNNIGVGLLNALNQKKQIVFTDQDKSISATENHSEHLVVVEEGNLLSEVIAANYAYSIGADICSIPEVSEDDADIICERFYSSSTSSRFINQSEELGNLKNELRSLSSTIPLDNRKILTFITRSVPWGFAYPEVPSTHIYSYPEMGLSLINAFVAEQPNSNGLSLALMIDPKTVSMSEVDSIRKTFRNRRISQKILKGPGATVYNVTRNIALLPYDLLLISTHCADVSGVRCTYKYTDSEGIARTLVTDIAFGISQMPEDDEKLDVMHFISFVSLDGVDWRNRKAKENLYVGKAMDDFTERLEKSLKGDIEFKPVKSEPVERVYGSSALKMWDHNYIPVAEQIAGQGSPIIINNACCSWHRLATEFMFANARGYIGTLFEVLDSHACQIVMKLTDKYFGKPLAVALWRSQNDVYQDSVKRPYVLIGPHFQKLRVSHLDHLELISRRLNSNYANTHRILIRESRDDQKKYIQQQLQFLKGEIEGLENSRLQENH